MPMVPDANHRRDRADDRERPGPATPDGVVRTGTYEAEDGTVFYDSEEPLAWLRIDRTYRLTDTR